MKMVNKIIIACNLILFFHVSINAQVAVKIKDLIAIDGLKENQIYGYGLVIGLQGTGDTKVALTRSSLINVLKNLGLSNENINSKKYCCSAVFKIERHSQ